MDAASTTKLCDLPMKSNRPIPRSRAVKRTAGSQQRVVRAWRRLKPSERIRAGDRQMYIDGSVGHGILDSEIGMTAAAAGYFGVMRQRSNAALCDPAHGDAGKPKTL